MILATSAEWIYYLLLCGLLGMVGQCVRAIGGAKKVHDQARGLSAGFKDVFDGSAFLVSIVIGCVAGISAGLMVEPKEIGRLFLLSVLAAGYAGADFIDAFVKKSVPDINKVAEASKAVGGPENLPAVKALGGEAPAVANAIRAKAAAGT